MRKGHGAAVTLVLALTAVPGFAQEEHQHATEEDSRIEMCSQMTHPSGMMTEGSSITSGGMHMMMRDMAGMPGMGMMLGTEPDAAVILRASEELGLDEEQTERLEAIRQRSLDIHGAHMEASVEARTRASELLGTDAPDLDAYEQALWEAAQHMVTAHLGLVRLSFEARDVLTGAQIERLDAGVGEIDPMRCTPPGGGAGSREGQSGHHRRRP